jgi:hypothetical protein
MAEEVSSELPVERRWAITPNWFSVNNRSMTAILENCLCQECNKKIHSEGKQSTPESLMEAILNCCSHSPGFINEKMPVLEAIFRFFLTNGNTPVTIEELIEQINRLKGGNAYYNSPEALLRILKADIYYGLQEIQY